MSANTFWARLGGFPLWVAPTWAYTARLFGDYRIEPSPEDRQAYEKLFGARPITISPEELEAENRDDGNWPPAYLESLAVYRKICQGLLSRDTVLFHCSALAIDGKAYLFTAPSGTGKSTHARLWRQRFGDRITTINDDKPLLTFGEKEVRVWGTPYGGKDNLQNNTSAPVAGILILHQAPENTIRPMSPQEAMPMLLNQTHRILTPEAMGKTLGLVLRLANLPVYSLGCTVSQEAVDLAYETLTRKRG